MKDFLDNDLGIGDKVVFIKPGYRDFSTGTIIRFTKYFVIIEKDKGDYHAKTIRQEPTQLIKVIKDKL